MTFQPAHKDIENPPGQIVNPIESNVPRTKTIGGIIDRVWAQEGGYKPHRTFEEWWEGVDGSVRFNVSVHLAKKIWKAARNED